MSPDQFYNKHLLNWKMTDIVQIGNTYCKLEHQNPTGSVKSRGLSVQIYNALQNEITQAVITSSGNAAIAASYYCAEAGIELDVFISNKTSVEKIERLQKYTNNIQKVSDPISAANEFCQKTGAHNLQQSINDDATIGFEAIAHELNEQLKEFGLDFNDVGIMMPVSSGTTCIGLTNGLKKLGKNPQIHVAQSTAVQTIVSPLISIPVKRKKSLVTGLVARNTRWKDDVVHRVKESGGTGWIVDDELVESAIITLSENGLTSSVEGALSFAADAMARSSNESYPHSSVVLLT